MKLKQLIINADDLGQDAQVNRAILETFQKRYCSSATLMPNMPGFEQACQLVRESHLEQHIGMHLVLRDGFPLTERIRNCHRFCDVEGRLHLRRKHPLCPILYLDSWEQKVLGEEIRAQIQKCRNQRIPLTHLDSHYDLHNEWVVTSVLLPILREEKIPYLRISRNCGQDLGLRKRLYKFFYNKRLAHAGVARTQLFGSLGDFLDWQQQHPGGNASGISSYVSFEVMIHPIRNDRGELVDGVGGKPLGATVGAIRNHQQAVSFASPKGSG